MRTADLLDEYLELMRRMTIDDVRELMLVGVPIESIAVACPVPAKISIMGDKYKPDAAGQRAWLVPAAVDPEFPENFESNDPSGVISGGAIVDLVAFHPAARGKFALRTGQGKVLGAIPPQYCNPPPVRVHRDVFSWLHARCNGIALLTYDPHEAGRILRQIDRIKPGCARHYDEIRQLIKLPSHPQHTVVELP